MSKIKKFFTTVLLGGFLAILPITIVLNILLWLIRWITNIIEPLTRLILTATHTDRLIAEFLSFALIISACFFIGLFIKTNAGKWLQDKAEQGLLGRIPGYKMLKELSVQLQSGTQRSFSKPVLFSLDKNDNYFIGYITEEYGEDQYAVFIPTSPSPMNGYVIQTNIDHLKFLDISAEKAMKIIVSCGVGSENIMTHIIAKETAKN